MNTRPSSPHGSPNEEPRRRPKWLRRAAAAVIVVIAIVVAAAVRQGGTVERMMTTGTVTSDDGTTIAFTRMGHGPALVLIDGALCFRENGPSRDIVPLLATHFTVYAYDRRGRGESSDSKPYTIRGEIDDLRAVLRQAGDSAFAFGASSGAVLAMQGVAAGLPIRKLIIYEPPIGVTRPGGPRLDEAERELKRLVTAGDSAGAARYFLTAVLGTPGPMVALMPVLMRGTWTKVKSVAHTLPYDLAILSDRSLLGERATAIALPTLVVAGASSPTYMQEAAERVARALPNGRALLLPGQSHDVSAAVKALIPVMTDFFAEPR